MKIDLDSKINDIVSKISLEIHDVLFPNNDISLYLGKSGVLLFDTVSNTPNTKDISNEVNEIIEIISKDDDPIFTYCGGISGTIWLINYLETKSLISLDKDFYKDIDDYLTIIAHKFLHHYNYDFLHGSCGIILTLLDRVESNIKRIELLIKKLLEIRIDYDGLKIWQFYSAAPEFKDKFLISLGLSHGLPALMMILAKCYQRNILREDCKSAIEDCYQFLKGHKNKSLTDEQYSYYPTIIVGGEDVKYSARLGWCYGDLGIGVAFYTVGNILDNQNMIANGIEIYDYYADAKNEEKFGIIDAQFCHGSSGVAHLFNRMYYNTGNKRYRAASAYWVNETLKMAHHSNAPAGYATWKGQSNGWSNSSYGLLEGVLGIGVVLSSYTSDEIPDWDECFLLS